MIIPLTPFSQVLFTTPAPYAPRLATALLKASLRPIWAPTIQTLPLSTPSDITALETALLTLPSHKILAFTSRTAIIQLSHHLTTLANNNPAQAKQMLIQSGIRLAALGSDALALKPHLGLTADILPLDPSPQGLVAFLASDPSLKGAAVLCPVPRFVDLPIPAVVTDFLDALREKGFVVTDVPVYQTSPVPRGLLHRELAWLLRNEVGAVAFTSCAEAVAFAAILGEEDLVAFRELVRKGDVFVAAQGPFTAKGVRDALGIDTVVASDNFASFDGLVDVLGRGFAERDAQEGKLLL